LPVRRALILAAGLGQRLRPLTTAVPKCLVEVNGVPILFRSLRVLASAGVTEAIIVVGYESAQVRSRVGHSFAGIDILYVDALSYETTNNIRSLWDARRYCNEDILLLEGDVVFDRDVVMRLREQVGSSMAVAKNKASFSGTVVHHDDDGLVTAFILGADQNGLVDGDTAQKTVNIYLLRGEELRTKILPELCRQVDSGNVQAYYETVLRDLVADGSLPDLVAVDVSTSRWYELDDHRDLEMAEFTFLSRNRQFDRIQSLHGSYWRYGVVDHSYLYNLHFPPAAMLDALRDELPEVVTNYPVGQTELDRLVAQWTGADPATVVVGNGAAELIKVLGQHFIEKMTIPVPSFNEYENVRPEQIDRVALNPVTLELDLDAFAESALRADSDVAVLVTPNNPTALSVDRAAVLELAGRLANHQCRLIVDESFIEFSRSGRAASVEGDVDDYPNLVIIKSMSKVFGIAGLRIGYLLTADRRFAAAVRAHLPHLEPERHGRVLLAPGRPLPERVRGQLRVGPRHLPGSLPLAAGVARIDRLPTRRQLRVLQDHRTRPYWTSSGPEPLRRTQHPDQGLRVEDYARRRSLPAHRVAHGGRESAARRRPVAAWTGPTLSAMPVTDVRGDAPPSPTIVSHLADAANLLTLTGLAASILAVTLALRGDHAGAAISLVGAFVLDVVDGPVAKRTPGRTREQGAFGANLDSLADMVSAGVALGVVILSYGHFRMVYLPVAVLLAAATAMRLSYFNVHGLDAASGTYTGLPTDLAIISFVALMLLDGPLGLAAFRVVLSGGGVVLAMLMVSPLRIPKLTGRWAIAVIILALVLAGAQAARLIA
jgi:NDP-sugar pyrophosphorylase family protein/phosphatidylserine synthase